MKKKFIIIISLILVILGISGGVYYYLNTPDNNTLTVLEKQWIEDNKNNVIDIEIEDDIPIFSDEGEGVVFNFLEELEEDTGLDFNKVSYTGEDNNSYAFKMVDKTDKNDIIIYEDNYSLITNKQIKYNSLEEVNNLKIGVLDADIEKVNIYLKGNDLSFSTYDNVDNMIEDLIDGKLDGITLPKTIYLKQILENNLTISYNITEMKKTLVIELGKTKKLNTIIKKYYSKWKTENFEENYNDHFSNSYYAYTKVEDDLKVTFKSKRYKYGFVTNSPYDKLINNKLVGINSEVIKEFSKLPNIEVTFTEYNSYADLIKAFNANKIDFFFNITDTNKYDMDVTNTLSIIDEEVVVLSNIKKDLIVNSIHSLNNQKVFTISNTQINKYLEDNKIETKKYKNIEKLIEKVTENSVIIIDKKTYQIYKHEELKDFEIDYEFDLDTNYKYTLRDIKENKLFNSYFNFYLGFTNEKGILDKVDYQTFEQAEKLVFVRPLIYTIFAIIVLIIITIIMKKIKENKKTKSTGVSKENKLRYIDMLTSLKNRNYLNDSIEKWDEAEVYPQTIIIADLNNIAYINDNYGHNEGDNVIKEAANILIKNQLEQSEIIRTNGNEFLIYLVGYEEKQVVSYIRKLTKEFKELEHGFGAAIGYSMINDGLKTVDDAINEATLDMKTNKEEEHE